LVHALLKDIPFLFWMVMTRSWLKLWQKLIPKPKRIIGDYKYIDEVQRIPNIGLKLKIIIDQIKDVQVIVALQLLILII
jgi:hypothetical protein